MKIFRGFQLYEFYIYSCADETDDGAKLSSRTHILKWEVDSNEIAGAFMKGGGIRKALWKEREEEIEFLLGSL